MKAKKKGSSLVLVLIFALIFTALSGVVVLAVVDTTRANSAQEIWEDGYYAAESAVETAVVKTTKGEFDTLVQGGPSVTYVQEIEFPQCTTFENTTTNVKVTRTGDQVGGVGPYLNEYFLVESTAKNTVKNQERTVKAKVKKNLGTGDLFKYVVCGEDVNIHGGGAGVIGSINSSDIPSDIIMGGTSIMQPGEMSSFTVPEFTFEEVPVLNRTINCTSVRLVAQLDILAATNNNGVRKINFTAAGGSLFKIYLVNSPDLKIDTPGETLVDTIILTNSDIKIKALGGIHLSNSSLVGKKMVVGEPPAPGVPPTGSITMDYPPYDNPTDIHAEANSHLRFEDLKNLNTQIAAYCTNWDADGAISGSGDYWDAMEYE